MDAFESIIATILEWDDWWVHRSFKVELTKAEKRKAGKPTMPRHELDVLAYKAEKNELLVIECKSFLDSTGVLYKGFVDRGAPSFPRYKLFNDPKLGNVVRRRLVRQLTAKGSCRGNPKVRLCLAAGHIASDGDREQIGRLFRQRNWRLMDDGWVANELRRLAESGYTNNEAIIAVKILEKAGLKDGTNAVASR